MALRKVASDLVTGLGVRVAVPQATSGSSTLMSLSSSFMKRGFATGTLCSIDSSHVWRSIFDNVWTVSSGIFHSE